MIDSTERTMLYFVCFLLIITAAALSLDSSPSPEPNCKPFQTDYVIDGDTIETKSGETLRLARIDAPEMNFQSPAEPEHGARDATDFLSFLVSAETCYIKQSTGYYGRTIAEIKVNVSDLMLESGNASYYESEPKTR